MSYTKQQGISDARAAIDTYQSQITQFKGQISETQTASAEIKKELHAACQQLAAALVTSTDAETVNALATEISAITLPQVLASCNAALNDNQAEYDQLSSAEAIVNQTRLLDPLVGTLVKAESENAELLTQADKIIMDYDIAPHFTWVKADAQGKRGVMGGIVDVLTLKFLFRNKYREECQAAVGDLNDAFSRYDDLISKLPQLAELDRQAKQALQDATEQVKRHGDLAKAITDFDQNTKNALIDAVTEHFESVDVAMIMKNIRTDAQVLLAKIAALSKKMEHFDDIVQKCRAEIIDRENRQGKIQTVLSKWSRSSKYYLSGDKTKWLVDTPRSCGVKTNRFCSAYSDQVIHIHRYDDYNSFSNLMLTGMAFSSFQAFAADTQVDSYVANQTFSEHQALAELPPEEVADVDAVLEDAEADMLDGEPEALDEGDES
ncbi:hypothetical protein [Alteromonas macleodii]|uniref:Uncharacterized protein n=1 Tax=Alteromonas macleodii TaxID=28108 RepID=A0AB36FRI1_ALTMA|nr:hypothetical protein [Alteromonas macleodii]OES24197.1 hypothetical protein BFV93_4797 [Alteromonas macleodii]OES24829.1 hypothetical protein BFV95_4588 [Alteromonas macleodii]OES25107.1 hypothetical protein BFV94_4578 [Alteromonas macleodii]OES39150.1 hypothetical protein BFV96_4298 [Alteromonas macleodii]